MVYQVVQEDTIGDPIELESLLGQYDPGTILVGPLLSSSESSAQRYFHIAGAGSKVYRTVNLGSIPAETDAQRQRAAVIEKLESHFTGVLTFGAHKEMAYAVHALWPNEETAEILASVTRAETSELTKDAHHHEGIDAGVSATLPPRSELDALLLELADDAKAVDAVLTHKPPLAPVPGRALPSFAIGAIGGVMALIAGAVVVSATRQTADGGRPTFIPPPLSSTTRDNDPSQVLAAADRPVSNQPMAPSVSIGRDGKPSQSIGAAPPSVPSQHSEIDKRASSARQAPATALASSGEHQSPAATTQIGPTPIAEATSRPQENSATGRLGAAEVATAAAPSDPPPNAATNEETLQGGPGLVPPSPSPTSQSSEVARTQPASEGPQSPPAENPVRRLDDDEIARLVRLGMDSLKSGDLSSARPLLQRAAEAGNANAALMLGATFDPIAMKQLGVVGVRSDIARARRWYERAEQLGSDTAAQELAKLRTFPTSN